MKKTPKTLSPLQVIVQLIKYRPWLYLLNGVMWVSIHTFPLFPGLITKLFFDQLTKTSNLISVWGIIALFIGFTFTRVLFIIGGFKTDILHRFSIGTLLRRNLLEKMMRSFKIDYQKTSIGEIISHYREDVEQIEDSVSFILDIIGNFLFASIAITILVSIDVKLTIYVFLPLVLVLALAHLSSKKIHKYRIASREATTKVTGVIGEVFSSIQQVKLSSNEIHIMKHMKDLNNKRHKVMLKDTLFNQLLDSIYLNTVHFGTGLILLLSAHSFKSGHFTIGDFSLFISYLAFVSDFILFFGYFIARYQQTTVSITRLQRLLLGDYNHALSKHNPIYLNQLVNKPSYDRLSEKDVFSSLALNNLTYTYKESNKGIKNINFTIERGDFIVITGRIGSGKTTLLKTILGLVPKENGELFYNGEKVLYPQDFFVVPRVAYTPQIPSLISDTIENNILLGLDKKIVNLDKALYQAVLEQDIKQLKSGLETRVGPKGVKLSGGQIQRVAAARMFVRDAELYLLDDISSALDVDTEKVLWERLRKTKDKTCVVISNKKIALQYATKIIVLKEGEIDSIESFN